MDTGPSLRRKDKGHGQRGPGGCRRTGPRTDRSLSMRHGRGCPYRHRRAACPGRVPATRTPAGLASGLPSRPPPGARGQPPAGLQVCFLATTTLLSRYIPFSKFRPVSYFHFLLCWPPERNPSRTRAGKQPHTPRTALPGPCPPAAVWGPRGLRLPHTPCRSRGAPRG